AGADQVIIAAADGRGSSKNIILVGGETQTGERVAPVNRHAAILAAANGEQTPGSMPLDETRAGEIRHQVTNIIANYLNVKTGKVQAWKVECDLADRELGKLDAAL